MLTAEQKSAALDNSNREWSNRQRRYTDIQTGLTAAGATALAASLAAKRKIAGKVLPARLHERMKSSNADDIRNTIALTGMTSGVVSGIHWSKKLREDAKPPEEREREALKNAKNYALATKDDVVKGMVSSGVAFTRRGLRPRRAFYRRPPRRRFV